MSFAICRRTALVTLTLPGTVLAAFGATSSIEHALQAGQWSQLLALLGTPQRGEPAWRQFLRGHAALALNRNDESVRSFLNGARPDAIGDWQKWATEYLQRHPGDSMAWYLRGDAHARGEAWSDAVDAFTKALKINESNALAWNARGVVHALKGRWGLAGNDFSAAMAKAPDFADACANTGIAYVLQSVGRKDALATTFGEANRKSRQFAIAKLGAASLQFGIGDWQQAAAAFQALSARNDPIGSVAAQNLAVVRFAERELLLRRDDAESFAGTSVTVQSQTRGPSSLEALNQKILRNEVGAAAVGGYDRWSKESAAALLAVGKAFPVAAPAATAVAAGLALSAIGMGEAANRMREEAKSDKKVYVTQAITESVDHYRKQPSIGNSTAVSNWLNSSSRAEAVSIGHNSGLSPTQMDALTRSGSTAGGAILNFQRAYTSKGAWGMYVPFGLVYTGIDWRSPANAAAGSDRNEPASAARK